MHEEIRAAWDSLKERMEAAGWTATEVQEQIKTVEEGICDLECELDDFEFDEMNDVL